MKDNKKLNIKNSIKNFYPNTRFLLAPYLHSGKLLMFLKLFSACLTSVIGSVVTVTVAQSVFDAIYAGKTLKEIFIILFVNFLIMLSVESFYLIADAFYIEWKKSDINYDSLKQILIQAQQTDYEYIDNPQYFNDFKFALDNYMSTSTLFFETFISLISKAAGFITIITVISHISIQALFISLVGMLLSTLIQSKSNKISLNGQMKLIPSIRKVEYIRQTFSRSQTAADLKSTLISKKLLHTFDAEQEILKKTNRKIQRDLGITKYALLLSETIPYYLIIFCIAIGLLSGKIESFGMYTTIIAASTQLNSLLLSLRIAVTNLQNVGIRSRQIKNFFEFPSKIERTSGMTDIPNGGFSLNIDNLYFTYPNSNFSLKALTLYAAPGETIAIVGENGAGKSTLMKLLLRLYDVDAGDIQYNGISIKEYDVHALRQKIGISFQQPNIYAMSIADNLQAYHHLNDSQMREALQKAGLIDICDKLNYQATKEFEPNGVMFSGGELQKFGLARLISGNFNLLLLDEPSSALDPIAEHDLTRLLSEQANSTTTIMVAHRLSTVRNADRIYVMIDGCIVESGSHDELMRQNGKYAKMFRKQAENYIS